MESTRTLKITVALSLGNRWRGLRMQQALQL
jgi:hypothetical protein